MRPTHTVRLVLAIASLGAVVAAPPALADSPSTRPAFTPFQDGDRVCFVGDSITRGGLYHSFIRLFYSTRYPERRIEYFNCGRSGGQAGDGINRLDWDVLPHRPTVATVMFGMNDVGNGPPVAPSPTVEKTDDPDTRIRRGLENVGTIVERLRAAGARVVLISPSIFDDTVRLESPTDHAKAGYLGKWTAAEARFAESAGLGFVDIHTPMAAVTAARQATDPTFTLVGKDRVHPGPVGHFVMAYTLLKAQGHAATVASFSLDVTRPDALKTQNLTIRDLQATDMGLACTWLAQALPFPVPEAAAPALELVPFQKELNREPLQVKGLRAGSYTVSFDAAPLGVFSAEQLAAGIDLADLTDHPDYRQAKEVAVLNGRLFRLQANNLRSQAWVSEQILNKAKIDISDAPAARKAIEAFLETPRGKSQYAKDVCNTVLEDLKKGVNIPAEIDKLSVEIRRTAVPRARRLEVKLDIRGNASAVGDASAAPQISGQVPEAKAPK